jgi:hypothetical protein
MVGQRSRDQISRRWRRGLAGPAVVLAALIGAPAAGATGWVLQSSPNPPSASTTYLSGVSCTSASNCFAVGQSDRVPLIEHWNGSAWAINNVSLPAGASQGELLGVSCSSATFCMAVGDSASATSNAFPLVYTWDGTSWRIPANAPQGAFSSAAEFRAVSCTSSTFCEAVGNVARITLAEVWNGAAWTLQNTGGVSPAQFNSVSCTSSTFCLAAGAETPGPFAIVPYVESYDGSKWTAQSNQSQGVFYVSPPNTNNSELTGVSCASATACQVVGDYTAPSRLEFTWGAGRNGSS